MGAKLSQEEVSKRVSENFIQKIQVISEYKTKRDNIKLQCLDCNFIWETKAANVLYIDGCKYHYCPNCGNPANKKNRIMLKCAYCGKEIEKVPSDMKKNKSGYFYCCKEHGNLHKNQLRKESGEWDNSLSYRQKALEIFPHKCDICGWNEDERILEVHHVDENRNNNKIDNLVILCPTCHRKITLGYYIYDKENHTLIGI